MASAAPHVSSWDQLSSCEGEEASVFSRWRKVGLELCSGCLWERYGMSEGEVCEVRTHQQSIMRE